MWFDVGIAGLVAFFFAFMAIIFRAMKANYIALAFCISIMFNITYESWLVASLNPFSILFLTLLTIFHENFSGAAVVAENESVQVAENKHDIALT